MSGRRKNTGMGLLLKRKGIQRSLQVEDSDNNENISHDVDLDKIGTQEGSLNKSTNVDEAKRITRSKNTSAKGCKTGSAPTEALILQGSESSMTTPVKRSARLAAISDEKSVVATHPASLKKSDTSTNTVSDKSNKKGKLSTQNTSTESPMRLETVSVVTPQSKRGKGISSLDSSSDSDTEDFVLTRNGSSKTSKTKPTKSQTPLSKNKISSANPGSLNVTNKKSRSVELQKFSDIAAKVVTPSKLKVKLRKQSKAVSEEAVDDKYLNDASPSVNRTRTPSPRFHLLQGDD